MLRGVKKERIQLSWMKSGKKVKAPLGRSWKICLIFNTVSFTKQCQNEAVVGFRVTFVFNSPRKIELLKKSTYP